MLDQNWQAKFNQLDSGRDNYLIDALELVATVDTSALSSPCALERFLHRLIVEIDQALSKQLSVILQHPEFKMLESNWRELRSLVDLPINYQRAKVKMMDVSWQSLSHDLNTANTSKGSKLYNHIGNKELNTLGGEPFGTIIVNHRVSMEMGEDDDFDDLFTLELLGQLGELILCPFILSVSDFFFGESDADWISDINRIEKILSGPDYVGWQRLRSQRVSRFIGLAMPAIKLRCAYKQHRMGFIFNETSTERSGLWGGAATAFVSTILREYNRIGWFGFMKSRWQDKLQGAVVNLPLHLRTNSPLINPQPEVELIGRLASFYAEQGFIPLARSPLTEKYFFVGNNSTWSPGASDSDRVSCQLQSVLMTCRFAHYLKVQIREMIGSFNSAAECERFLSRWLDSYCSNVVDADENILAKYPLSKGRVTVKEVAEDQGRFVCEVLIKPQYHYDHFCGDMFLSTDSTQGAEPVAVNEL